MTIIQPLSHKFELSCLTVGNEFLGCPNCWFRFDPDTAVKPECPKCGQHLNLYTITPEDIQEVKK